VARDRQRSKQRRRRASQKAGNPARSRAREIGLDDASVDEAGLTDTVPAPDPLKNASAEVDQARAAEAGIARGPAGEEIDVEEEDVFAGEDDLERAPDELETPADLVDGGGRGGRAGRGGLTQRGEGEPAPAHEQRQRGRIITFLRACIEELRRVQWPDRKHVFQATAVVLGFVLVAGGWLGLMDAIWQPLINAIL
jgi:preprotein translocase SecE subunit